MDNKIHIEIKEPNKDLISQAGYWYDKTIKDIRISKIELMQMSMIWDENCDQILYELVDKYHWDTPTYINESIINYLSSDALEAYKESCKQNCSRVWYNIIYFYGIRRIHELEIRVRKPKFKKCLGCGKKFIEASIYRGTAQRVGYKILFCWGCYTRALYGEGKEKINLSRQEMINKLTRYVEIIGYIPLKETMQNINLSDKTEDEQGLIVKYLLDIPTYEQYVEEFGSWLKALTFADIIDDKSLRSKFGYRCLALDGHECLSIAEKYIDDWLFNHNIEHEIEPLYPYHQQYNPHTRKRADWKVGDVYIEFAGLMENSEYAEKMYLKKQMANELGITLIMLEYEDTNNLDESLATFLRNSSAVIE